MLADVVVPTGSRRPLERTQLYTYAVPPALRARVALGQLVAVPFGARAAAGIIWALHEQPTAHSSPTPLRQVAALLTSAPVIRAEQRALLEWLAEHYCASLAATVRLALPPGLLASVRLVLRPAPPVPLAADVADEPDDVAREEAYTLALLHAQGRLAPEMLRGVFGATRASEVTETLVARGAAHLDVEVTRDYLAPRRETYVHLAAEPNAVAAWQASARAALDAPAPEAPADAAGRTAERRSERLLRQLAVVEILARDARQAERAPWRLRELRKLTRITDPALRELTALGLVALREAAPPTALPVAQAHVAATPLHLSAAQSRALERITRAIADAPQAVAPRVVLLHGITGSGKTEIYLQALAEVLASGRRGIVLVPEIGLTPQAMARYTARFPGRVALLHSALTPSERQREWQRIHAGEADIVLGSRSALFAPVERVGLIVVDEEHDSAYKESRPPTYHARDVAVTLGQIARAAVVLGSATPAVESYWRATQGAYELVELTERAPAGRPGSRQPPALPPVRVVDLRAELRAGNTSILSQPLQQALQATLARGEQAILFLNRRGLASSVLCRECGYVARCTHCDVSLTLHAQEGTLLCHYCGARATVPTTCPVCQSASIRYFGVGTERVESAVKRLFPAARVLRWDRDTVRAHGAHEQLLLAFAERRADVLVGTQMIAKGLDLPGVTLVGVISADTALFLPDFRASERAFQLLTQVAGRAGRGAHPGQVLMQTLNPEHFCIQAAAQHDYATFVAAELAARARFAYVPFRRFVTCTFAHADRYTAQGEALALAEQLERAIRAQALPESDVVGPAPAFTERVRGLYRWQLILRSPAPDEVLRALETTPLPYGWSIDVDPVSTL